MKPKYINVPSEVLDGLLKTKKKKWDSSVPINFAKTKKVSANIKYYANDLIIWDGNKLSDKFLRTKTEDERDEIAKDLLNFFLQFDWNMLRFSETDLKKDFQSLVKFEPKIFTINKQTYIKNTGTSGSKLVRHFFTNLLKISGNKMPSIWDAIHDKERLFHIIRNRLGNTLLWNPNGGTPYQFPMNITPTQIITGAKNSGLASMGSNFKASVAKGIYNHWCKDGDKVLDYSCGFGGRLFGCMTSGKNLKYYGFDPNTETYKNLLSAVNYFGFDANIKCGESENTSFDEKFDFLFSSPAYHDHEIYCDEATQSYNKFPNYDEWLEGHWRATVRNIRTMMHRESVFAVNVGGNANKKMIKIAEDFKKIITEEGFCHIDTWNMLTSKSHLSSKKGTGQNEKVEYIFFFRKLAIRK